MTKSQALQYVRSQSDDDKKDEAELEEAFTALFERAPDDADREQGLWPHVCRYASAEEAQAVADFISLSLDANSPTHAIMNTKIAKEVQAEQDRGRAKYRAGSKLNDADQDPANWHEYIEEHNNRAKLATPMERRQYLVKVAGLAVSAIEAFDLEHMPEAR